MPLHILKMTANVEVILDLLLTQDWAKGIGRDPNGIVDGDTVLLLGHGGGQSTIDFVNKWIRLKQYFLQQGIPFGKTNFVLLMCGQGPDGGSDQLAELIKNDGARSVGFCNKTLLVVYIMEMPQGIGVTHWSDLDEREDGEIYEVPGTDMVWCWYCREE